jgi:hypothetical protein
MNLYLVYCGYYESDSAYGWNERHVTVPVVALSEEDAVNQFKSQVRPSS